MAAKDKIRIRLKGYDHNLVDKASEQIVETAKRSDLRSRTAAHRERDRHDPSRRSQVQGFP